MLAAGNQGLDIRFAAGGIAPSDLRSSWKKAEEVVRQIERFGLARIEDHIDSLGCVMAGDAPALWRDKTKRQP